MSQIQAEPAPPVVDEREPLLTNVERDPEEQLDDIDDVPLEKKTSLWTYGWYTVLTILVGVALGFFVKGFIDADDVEVRSCQRGRAEY